MPFVVKDSIIQGGTFINSGGVQSKGFKILHGKIAVDAFHNSGERFDAPKCHPKTRIAVLDDIMRWILQDLSVAEMKDILWLYGPAGAGKSAIAQTIAEMCAKLGLLIASFFFFRTSSSRNNEKSLIASIAYQLALAIPETRPFIESAVQLDPSVFDKSLEIQVETLIILPLEQARSIVTLAVADKWPRLILIDGLDECNGHSIQRSIIRTLSTALLHHRVPLILFVASRPEPHIRNAFNALDISHSSLHIVLDNSYHPDADIKEFLLSRFKEIKENHPLATFIPKSWPPAEIIDRLVQQSSGQFIYASTVMKYLDSPKHKPMKRLNIIIGLIPVGGDSDAPYKELDALYTHIFSCVENIASVLQIIGFILFHRNGRPTPEFLECLFGLDQGEVHLCLSELHSILDIPPPKDNDNPMRMLLAPLARSLVDKDNDNPIRMFHASLGDFLVDKLRSGNYYLDEVMVHTDIAQRCLPRISTSINEEQSSTINDIATPYSTLNFAYHCSRASPDSKSLRENLIQSNLREWFGQSLRLSDNHLDILLFEWLEKADTSGRLLKHVRDLWDQSLLAGLNNYAFEDNGVDLAVILMFPRRWALRILRMSEYPDVLHSYFLVEPTSTREGEAHCKLFIDFFGDHKRSGKYHVNGKIYAHAALKCIRYLFDLEGPRVVTQPAHLRPRSPGPSPVLPPRMAARFTITADSYSVLESMVTILSMASPLNSLCSALREYPLDDKENIDKDVVEFHPLARLKSAVQTYLEKCDIESAFLLFVYFLALLLIIYSFKLIEILNNKLNQL